MGKGLQSRTNKWRWLAWLLPAGVLLQAAIMRHLQVMAWPELTQELGPADTDAWLRLAQVRQWLAGGDFFSHAVPNTNAPNGGISIHWTRPMDALLAVFHSFMPGGLGVEKRLMLAAAWLPPALGLAAFALLVRAVRRCFDNVHAIWFLVLLLALGPLPQYFPPGDADHHGLLVLLWCGVVGILMRPLTTAGGLVAGILLGLMIWINIEGLLLYAGTCAILGVSALLRPHETRPLAYLTLGAALVVALGLVVEVPPRNYLAFQAYDTLSIVYVALLALVSAGAFALSAEKVVSLRIGQRLGCAIAVAAAVLAVEILLFPEIVKGPLAHADPFITQVFFPRVLEAKPMLSHPGIIVFQHLWQPVLAVLLLLILWRRSLRPAHRLQIAVLAALILLTLCMTLVQGRWTCYLQVPALIALASFAPAIATAGKKPWRWLKSVDRQHRPYAALLVLVVVLLGFAAPFDVPGERDQWNCQAQIRYAIQTGQLQKVLGDGARVIYAPPEIAGDFLFFTPYRIIAGGYHREGKGLRHLQDIEDATEPAEARRLLAARGADSMFVCPVTAGKKSWLRHLSFKQHPPWLEPEPGLEFRPIPGPRPLLFSIR